MFDKNKMVRVYGFKKPTLYNYKSKHYLSQKSKIFMLCDYCKNSFEISVSDYKKRISRRKAGYSETVCQKPECRKIQKSKVGKSVGKKNIKSGLLLRMGKMRKGKSHKEYYGVDRAKTISEKIRIARLKQEDPRLGTHHSKKTKAIMSEKKLLFYKKAEPIYISTISGEQVDFSTRHAELMRANNEKLTDNQRWERSRGVIFGIANGKKGKKTSKTGVLKHWHTEKMVRWESSYEYVYFSELNKCKKFWKRNQTTIIIPYKDLKGVARNFTPDALIYSDSDYLNLEAIVEVKPYDFIYNPRDLKDDYHQISVLKRQVMEGYCKSIGVKALVITEQNLNLEIARRLAKRVGTEWSRQLVKRIENLKIPSKRSNTSNSSGLSI